MTGILILINIIHELSTRYSAREYSTYQRGAYPRREADWHRHAHAWSYHIFVLLWCNLHLYSSV